MKSTPDPWEYLFLKNRSGDLLALVIHLTKVMIRDGGCTADAVSEVPISGNPSIRGAAFRAAVRFGIAVNSGRYQPSASKLAHNRNVFFYELASLERANLFLNACQREMTQISAGAESTTSPRGGLLPGFLEPQRIEDYL